MATLILHHDDQQNNIVSKNICILIYTLEYYGYEVLKGLLSSRNLFCLTLPEKSNFTPTPTFQQQRRVIWDLIQTLPLRDRCEPIKTFYYISECIRPETNPGTPDF